MSRCALALLGAIALVSTDRLALGSRVADVELAPEPAGGRRVIEEIRARARQQRQAAGMPKKEEREALAARVVELEEFKQASTIHVYPAAPLYPIRLAALRAGKKLVVTFGNLTAIYLVDPANIAEVDLEEAASSRGMRTFGTSVDVNEPIKIDLYLIKSLAVDPVSAQRIGPPGNFEELEYAMYRHMKALDQTTPVVTMIDSFGVVEGIDFGQLSDMLCAKVPADIVCTPDGTIHALASPERIAGLDFSKLNALRFRGSRLLRRLRAKTLAGEMP